MKNKTPGFNLAQSSTAVCSSIFVALGVFILSPSSAIAEQSQVLVGTSVLPYDNQTLDSIADYSIDSENLERSKYGGWNAQRYDEGSGFFRVEEVNGRWWAIDPEGYLYTHMAINTVSLNNFTADEIYELLTQYGFNGMGNWSDEDIVLESTVKDEMPLAYTPKLSFVAEYRRDRDPRIEMPIFDDEFETFCNEEAEYFAQYVDDPQVFGYFSDNELPWLSDGLSAHLEITDTTDKNYIAAIDFLESRGKTASDWDDDDQYAYVAYMAERYYSIVSTAIKNVDSNHMYLGTRAHSSERYIEDFMVNAGKYVDVFSTNHYGRWGLRQVEIENMSEWSGRPLLLTEFYAQEDPDAIYSGAGWKVTDQESRGPFYQNFVSTFAESGDIVGFHWFRFQDTDNHNKGVIDVDGNPHVDLLDHMGEINEQIYNFIDYADSRQTPDATLEPEADAYYKGSTNYGDATELLVKNASSGYYRASYLRFDLSTLDSIPDKAEVHLKTVPSGSNGGMYQAELVTDDSWEEMSININNAPEGSTVLATWSDGDDVTIDVTDVLLDALTDNNKLSIRIISTLSNGNIPIYGSRENEYENAHPELQVYYPSLGTNIALDGTATQSSTKAGGNPARAIDNNTSGVWGDDSVTHTQSESQPWWELDLGGLYDIDAIQLFGRTDSCCQWRLTDYDISILDEDRDVVWTSYQWDYPDPSVQVDVDDASGRYVLIQLRGTEALSLAEVQVFGELAPVSEDIGSVEVAGSVSVADETITIEGSGADIWNTEDAFHFYHQPLSGDGEIVVRVESVENTNKWAKAGVMIRESLDADSAFAMVCQRPDNQVTFQWRSSTGEEASYSGLLAGGYDSAKFIRLVRSGDSFSGYYSTSSASGPWTQIDSDISIPMSSDAYTGLSVTSHNSGTLTTAVFDNLSISQNQ